MTIIKLRKITGFLVFVFLLTTACKERVDIAPHEIDPKAEVFFQGAMDIINEYVDVDSTRKAIELINKAIDIDNMNPDYHGVKAKLYAEMGQLATALEIQENAEKIGAVNGEYLLQLGLFQAAKGDEGAANISFGKSNDYLKEVLRQYPDSLGAFINQQAANSLYYGEDSLFMNNVKEIRDRFPDRLMEIEMTRRVKPHNLIRQIKAIEQDAINEMIMDIDRDLFLNGDE